MKSWLLGRKTYILSVLVILIAFVLVLFQRVTPETALPIVLVVLGLFAATFRAALQQHHDETIQILSSVAAAGMAVAAHNVSGAVAAGMQVAQESAQLDVEIQQGAKS